MALRLGKGGHFFDWPQHFRPGACLYTGFLQEIQLPQGHPAESRKPTQPYPFPAQWRLMVPVTSSPPLAQVICLTPAEALPLRTLPTPARPRAPRQFRLSSPAPFGPLCPQTSAPV